MNPTRVVHLLIALLLVTAVAAAQETGRKQIPDEKPDRRVAIPQPKPQEKPKAEDDKTKPRISDLTHPMRAKRVGKPKKNDPATSPDALLRLMPGMGGDALSGISSSESKLSPDVELLIRFSRKPGSQANRRAAARSAMRGRRFFNANARGAPAWAERAKRDGHGRITSMRDASGNRVKFKYDDKGMVKMQSEPVGPYNPKLGDSAGSYRNPQRGGLRNHAVFDNRSFAYRGTAGARLNNSSLSHYTRSEFDSKTGGRRYTTFDVRGRPSIRVGSDGKIVMNRYDAMGRLIGTYDGSGKLTIVNHDELGRPNFGVDKAGNRAMLDPNRMGGMVLGNSQGSVFKGGGNYGQINPGAFEMLPGYGPPGPQAPIPSPTVPSPNYPRGTVPKASVPQPKVPQPGVVPIPQQMPTPHQPGPAKKEPTKK